MKSITDSFWNEIKKNVVIILQIDGLLKELLVGLISIEDLKLVGLSKKYLMQDYSFLLVPFDFLRCCEFSDKL